MKCLNCQNEINNNSNFCEYCGKKIEKNIFCSNCGSKIESGNYCTNCGNKINISNDIILNVTRQKKTLGFAVSFTVSVDGIVIGKLKNGETLSYNISPGKHVVNIESVEKNNIQEISVDNNINSVEIIVVAKMGVIAANAKLVEIVYK